MRFVLVADDPLVRAGLAALLDGTPDLVVSAQLAGDEDVAEAARAAGATVALWDLGPSPGAGLERLTRAAAAGLPTVALVHHDEDAAEAIGAGARGALSRLADGPRMAAALVAVQGGLVVLDEPLAASVLRPRQLRPAALIEPLTPRESEVLQLLAQGLANKAIAERLGISDHTAKFHVTSILGKLGAQTRTEAIVSAARLGLVLL